MNVKEEKQKCRTSMITSESAFHKSDAESLEKENDFFLCLLKSLTNAKKNIDVAMIIMFVYHRM